MVINRIKQLARASLALIMVLSVIQIMPFELELVETASAGSAWYEYDWSGANSYDSSKSIDNESSPGDLKLVKSPWLYFTQYFNYRIVKTKINGDGMTFFGTQGTGQNNFSFPTGISYDNTTGYLYITDSYNGRIVKTKIDGSGWTTFGTEGSGMYNFSNPWGIDHDKTTDFIYVSDTYNHRIVKTQTDGSGWQTNGSFGNGIGQYKYPVGIDFDNGTGSEHIYIADQNNHRVVRMNMTGDEWTTLGGPSAGSNVGQFNQLGGIDTDNSTGTMWLYIGDSSNHRIVKTQLNGSGWESLGTGFGDGVGQFWDPRGIVYDNRTDHIYVADRTNDRIVRTRIDGSDWLSLDFAASGPWDIDIGSITYHSNGSLISNGFNKGPDAKVKTIEWTETTPANTAVKFQLRGADMEVNLPLKSFIGPDGTTSTYYNTSGQGTWSGHDTEAWIQYKVILETSDELVTPMLHNVTIKYNLVPPKPTHISPTNNSWTKDNTPTFNWTFTDFDSGNNQSSYQLQTAYNAGFTPTINDTGEVISNKTTFTDPGFPYNDGPLYWHVRVKDQDGDWSQYSDYWCVNIDTTAPISTVTAPVNNSYYNSLNTISGTSDDGTGSGLNKIEILIMREDNFYWNGTGWNSTPTWLLAAGTTSWPYDSSGVGWSSGTNYTVQVKGTDNITNKETAGSGNTFLFDNESPISTITSPANNSYLNTLPAITGTSNDPGGADVNIVQIRVERTSDGATWNGTGWNTTIDTWLDASGTTSWSYVGINWISDEWYEIRVSAEDNANNLETTTNWITFYFDDIDPIPISVQINNDTTYTNTTLVTLNLSAFDSGSGVNQIAYSNNGTVWEPWETYSQYKSHTLPAGDGPKTVHYKVEDLANNTATTSDSIILDTTPPIGLYIAIEGGLPYTNSLNVQVTLNAGDTTSGLNRMAFSDDNLVWTNWEPFNYTKSYVLNSGDGTKTVYFKVEDLANNTAIASDTIILDTTSPSPISITINGGDVYTNIQNVELTLQAIDFGGSGVELMAFSDNGTIWEPWETFNTSKSYALPSSEEGTITIYFRVRDYANNIAYASDSILLDTSPPALSININDNAVYTNITDVELKLAVDDGVNGSGVNRMAFSDNGTIWSDWDAFTPSKSYMLPTGEGIKTVYFKAEDFANNSIFTSGNIILDTHTPDPISIVINDNEPYTNSTSVQLTLMAVDYGLGSGINRMAFSPDGNTWSGWEDFAGTKSYALSAGEGEKTVYFKVEDLANNTAYASDMIILDSMAPSPVSIVINVGDIYTNSTRVKLKLSVVESGTGVSQMAFSTDNLHWDDWEPYNTTKSYTLTSGDGTKTVYFRVRDHANNIGHASASIVLDTTPPHSLSITINEGAAETDKVNVTLDLGALDETSGVHQMAFSNDNVSWNDWGDYIAHTIFTMLQGDGLKSIYFKVNDLVGNEAEPVSASITLVTTHVEVDDLDNDGYPDDEDAFPNDPTEWENNDNDDIGDNADTDDDNDGYLDEWETFLGTGPKDNSSKPIDTDGDGEPDGDEGNTQLWMDRDDDDDYYTDEEEAEAGTDPLDENEYPVTKEEKDEIGDIILYLILVIVIVTVIAILGFAMRSKKKEVPDEAEEDEETEE